MSNEYDPHDGSQLKFLREDPTGRTNPIVDEEHLQNVAFCKLLAVLLVITFIGLVVLYNYV